MPRTEFYARTVSENMISSFSPIQCAYLKCNTSFFHLNTYNPVPFWEQIPSLLICHMHSFISLSKTTVETKVWYFGRSSKFFYLNLFGWYDSHLEYSLHAFFWGCSWVATFLSLCMYNNWFLLTLHVMCDICVCVFIEGENDKQWWDIEEGFFYFQT